MKFAPVLAAILALGAIGSAQALDGTSRARTNHHGYMLSDTGFEQHRFTPQAHHSHACIGFHSGTAHHSCGGTRTGGPVGGIN